MPGARSSFLSEFVLPLLEGGKVRVGPPIGDRELFKLRSEVLTGSDASQLIERARERIAAELWPFQVNTPFDDDSLAITVGVHNLLFLSHPEADGWKVSAKLLGRVERFTAAISALEPPGAPSELLARHTLLHHLFSLSRTDTELEYWAARHTFSGMEPPRRLSRWPRARRVRQRKQTIVWLEKTELSQGQTVITERLLRASPLTDLLHPLRRQPSFDWARVASYLANPQVSRLVAHRYCEMELSEVGRVLAKAFWHQAASFKPDQPSLRTMIGLIWYLFALKLLSGEPEETLLIEVERAEESLGLIPYLASPYGFSLEAIAWPEPTLAERLRRFLEHHRLVHPQEHQRLVEQLDQALRSSPSPSRVVNA
jgi:hypothetical protein